MTEDYEYHRTSAEELDDGNGEEHLRDTAGDSDLSGTPLPQTGTTQTIMIIVGVIIILGAGFIVGGKVYEKKKH